LEPNRPLSLKTGSDVRGGFIAPS